MHHDIITKMTNKMQLSRLIYCSLTAVRVSSDVFAHHQEHLNCIYSFWYYSRMSLPAGVMDELEPRSNSSVTPAGSDFVVHYQMLYIQSSTLDDGRKHRPKHVELTRNNKLTSIVASCWPFS